MGNHSGQYLCTIHQVDERFVQICLDVDINLNNKIVKPF